jgi:hypothetical protein
MLLLLAPPAVLLGLLGLPPISHEPALLICAQEKRVLGILAV